MAIAAIIVNGVPTDGKSALSAKLAVLLGCPLLQRDAVSQRLAEITDQMVSQSDLDRIAMNAVWSLAAAVTDGVVIDALFDPRYRESAEHGVRLSGATKVVEVWCGAANEPMAPLGAWPLVRVDTSADVDFDALLPELAGHLL